MSLLLSSTSGAGFPQATVQLMRTGAFFRQIFLRTMADVQKHAKLFSMSVCRLTFHVRVFHEESCFPRRRFVDEGGTVCQGKRPHGKARRGRPK